MTSSAWLAIGAVVASLVGPGLAPASLVLLATAVGVGVAGLRLRRGPGGRGRAAALVPIAIGAIVIALRLATSSGSAGPPADRPDGSGPWTGSCGRLGPARRAAGGDDPAG